MAATTKKVTTRVKATSAKSGAARAGGARKAPAKRAPAQKASVKTTLADKPLLTSMTSWVIIFTLLCLVFLFVVVLSRTR